MSEFMSLLNRHDERVLHFLIARRLRGLDLVMHVATRIADPVPAVLMAIAMSLIPQMASSGQRGLFALAVSHIWVQVVKRYCCRARPVLPIGVESLIRAPDRFSFPSGHSAAGMSIALALSSVVAFPFTVVVALTALLIGLSRCYLGVHYPGDVLAGWVLANLAYALGGVMLA